MERPFCELCGQRLAEVYCEECDSRWCNKCRPVGFEFFPNDNHAGFCPSCVMSLERELDELAQP